MFRISARQVALLLLLVSASLFAYASVPSSTAIEQVADLPELTGVAVGDLGLIGPDGRVQVMIELADPPTARIYAKELARLGGESPSAIAAANDAAQRHLTIVEAAQARVGSLVAAAQYRATELYRAQKVYNGIAAFVAADSLHALGRLAGVKAVHYLIPEYPQTSTSVPFLGTPEVWANTLGLPAAAQGEGISIGIIDTGVDYQHGNFGGTALMADYAANDRTVAPDAFFPSARVVGGFDFAGDAYTGSNAPVPDPDPMDCNGHGSHVAGIAAGGGVNADGTPFIGPYGPATPFGGLRIGPGTAPAASIYALRVFGCAGSTGLTVSAIEWAADPNDDGDFSDHLDVINMSLGSNFGGRLSTSAVASDNASLVGVIVAAASGNAGDTNFITSSPGSGDRVLSVANTLDSGLAGAVLTLNSPAGVAGNYPAVSANFVPLQPAPSGQTATLVLVDDGDPTGAGGTINDGCQTPFVNAAAVAGNIAVIDRGVCGFIVKAQNAQLNGAIGVIVASVTAGDPVPIVMGGTAPPGPAVTIPAVFVAKATRDTITGAGTVNGTLGAANPADTVSASSSRGPRRASSPVRLKPDIAAPGTSITSTRSGIGGAGGGTITPDSQSLTISGTSMATPHIAGIVALLRQLHPDWTVEQIKARAMNGSLHDTFLGADSAPPRFGLSRIGAGRIDVPAVAADDVTVYNADDPGLVSVSFDTEVIGVSSQQKTVRVVNQGTTNRSFNLALSAPLNDAPGVSFSLPGGSSLNVPAGASVDLVVQMSATAGLMDHVQTDGTLSLLQAAPGALAALGNQPRHYLTEEGAYLEFTDAARGGGPALRLPIYVGPRPASTMTAPAAIVTGGAPSGTTTLPLSGTDICTGTLGPGPTCSGTFPVDEVSLVSPFELQVVSGRDTVNAPGFADVQYAGVAFDSATSRYHFGVSTWEEWSTPTDVAFNIYVDTNEDGTYDRLVANTNTGTLSTALGSSQNPTDTFVNTILNLATNGVSVGGAAFYVNGVSAAVAETAIFNNNVMFLSATAAQLGLTAGDTTFRYRIETCPGFAPFCGVLNGFQFDDVPGPFFYNSAAQGLNFGNGTTLFFDLNGAAPSVTWNTANLATNGSLGALLLHHHNAAGQRAEVVILEGATAADLGITKSMAPPAPTLGQNVTFTITVSNAGPDAASAIQVTDLLPAGFTYVSDNGAGAYDDGTGIWTVPGAIAAAGSTSLQITGTLDTTDPIVNTAAITASTPLDPNPADNQSSVTINAPEIADLEVTMSVSSPTVLVGQPVTFSLELLNNGGDVAYSLDVNEQIVEFLRGGTLDPTSFVASHGVYDPATGLWEIASLATGVSATLDLTFTAPNIAGPLTDEATAGASTSDSDNANNTASATTMVLSPSAVTATKTAAGNFVEGGTVTYTVVLTNAGPSGQLDNPGDEFTDVLDAGLTLTSASSSSGTATATVATNTVTWNGSIPVAGTVTITIEATINPGTGASVIANQGTTSTDQDGNGTNETAGVTDDPAGPGAADPTEISIGDINVLEIPTLSQVGLAVLGLVLAGFALVALGRRRIG
jgi:uncharacterized repeat protein (TIGR01451 family)